MQLFVPRAVLRSLLLLTLAGACSAPAEERAVLPGVDVVPVSLDGSGRTLRRAARSEDAPRVLCVTAHPDDEIAFAGVVYKTATHLGGRVDLCVLTDGQGGFKYSTLAEPLHGLELTDEEVGRVALPTIRREELRRGCAWLGFDTIYHVDEPDHRYTQDVDEVLGAEARVWDLERVRAVLFGLVPAYDVVLVMAPTEATHAHHKAASLLAAEAVAAVPDGVRPALLCVQTQGGAQAEIAFLPEPFPGLTGWPLSRPANAAVLVFDRRQPFGFRERLDYGIVANWAIAEHKSQGTMQLLTGAVDRELYTVLAPTPSARMAELRRWFARLTEPQFETKTYDASAGTNAIGPAMGNDGAR